MARSTVALALLGMLACAACAMADKADVQKKHKGSYDKDNKKDKDSKYSSITLTAGSVQPTPRGNAIGDTAVVTSGQSDKDNNPIAEGRLTGIIASEQGSNAYTFNADLSIKFTDGRFKDSILTAAGPVVFDLSTNNFAKHLDALVITGATGKLEGVEGYVVLSNETSPPTVTLNMRNK